MSRRALTAGLVLGGLCALSAVSGAFAATTEEGDSVSVQVAIEPRNSASPAPTPASATPSARPVADELATTGMDDSVLWLIAAGGLATVMLGSAVVYGTPRARSHAELSARTRAR